LSLDVLGILIVSVYWLMVDQVAASVFNGMFALISGFGYAIERWPATRPGYWVLYPLILVSIALSGGGEALLAAAGTAFAVVGVQQRQLRRLRVLVTLGAVCWLAFGVVTRSPSQIVFGVLFIAGHLRSLVHEERVRRCSPDSVRAGT
jgi:hypothetical protein